MQLKVFIFVSSLFIFANSANQDLPHSFPKCKRNDPHLNQCLLEATERVKPLLLKGVQELGFPTLEPFFVSEIKLEQGTRTLKFKASLKNITVEGLSGYKFSQFDLDVPQLLWVCQLTIPVVKVRGTFSISGQILFVPVEGNGHFFATVENVNVSVVHKGELYKKRRLEYIKPIFTNTSVTLKSPEISFDGFANNEINRMIDVVISDNINELFEDFKPTVDKTVAGVLEGEMFKLIEDKVPYDKLYPME